MDERPRRRRDLRASGLLVAPAQCQNVPRTRREIKKSELLLLLPTSEDEIGLGSGENERTILGENCCKNLPKNSDKNARKKVRGKHSVTLPTSEIVASRQIPPGHLLTVAASRSKAISNTKFGFTAKSASVFSASGKRSLPLLAKTAASTTLPATPKGSKSGRIMASLSHAGLVAALGLLAVLAPFEMVSGGSDFFNSASHAAFAAFDDEHSAIVSVSQSAQSITPLVNTPEEKTPDFMRGSAGVAQAESSSLNPQTSCTPGMHRADEAGLVVDPLPTALWHVSSPFGNRAGGFHSGVDMAAPLGSQIRAAASGKVVYTGAGREGRSSNIIIIEHSLGGRTYWTWYVHMFESGLLVKTGDEVGAGQVIALVGNNGRSTGPHLHFEVHPDQWENLVNPLTWLNEMKAVNITDVCEVKGS